MTDRPLIVLELAEDQVVAAWHRRGREAEPLVLARRRAGHAFAEAVARFPDADIAWLDPRFAHTLTDPATWPALRAQPTEMLHSGYGALGAAAQSFGYVDFDSPFILPPPEATRFTDAWIAPVAGCARAAALHAAHIDPRMGSLDAVLADAGLRALGLGLVPRTAPGLFANPPTLPVCDLGFGQVARLIGRHRGPRWLLAWLAASLLFERRPHVLAALRGLLGTRRPRGDQARADALHPRLAKLPVPPPTVDALIPTLGRPQALRNLLDDLARQHVALRKAVVIEQRPDGMEAVLGDLGQASYPFAVDHLVVPWTGACRARNAGLERLGGDFVLMLDDDLRLGPTVVDTLLRTALTYQVETVVGAVRIADQQPAPADALPRPWPYFASGAALVAQTAIERAGGFDEAHEGGFGEDFEYGLRLRQTGSEILLQPAADVLHLKAPRGGFRHDRALPWDGADPVPKPSPTVLYARRRQLSRPMVDGYRFFYTVKRLAAVTPLRWPAELRRVLRGWRASEAWSDQLVARGGENHHRGTL